MSAKFPPPPSNFFFVLAYCQLHLGLFFFFSDENHEMDVVPSWVCPPGTTVQRAAGLFFFFQFQIKFSFLACSWVLETFLTPCLHHDTIRRSCRITSTLPYVPHTHYSSFSNPTTLFHPLFFGAIFRKNYSIFGVIQGVRTTHGRTTENCFGLY